MHRNFFCLSLLLLLPCFVVLAQKPSEGRVEIIQDERIIELLNRQFEMAQGKTRKIPGYRIKIHFGIEKAKAKEAKAKFLAVYPDVPAYEAYEQPNFIVKVGDFRTRIDAYRFLKEIAPEFPNSFLIKDDIELPKLE